MHKLEPLWRRSNILFTIFNTHYLLFFRLEILKIHAAPIAKHGEMDYEAVVKLSDTFNGADLRNVCTEAGLFAIRAEREYIIQVFFCQDHYNTFRKN